MLMRNATKERVAPEHDLNSNPLIDDKDISVRERLAKAAVFHAAHF